jgi:hypothetical protein
MHANGSCCCLVLETQLLGLEDKINVASIAPQLLSIKDVLFAA